MSQNFKCRLVIWHIYWRMEPKWKTFWNQATFIWYILRGNSLAEENRLNITPPRQLLKSVGQSRQQSNDKFFQHGFSLLGSVKYFINQFIQLDQIGQSVNCGPVSTHACSHSHVCNLYGRRLLKLPKSIIKAKSLYISFVVSNIYGTEYEIWAGFVQVGSTENYPLFGQKNQLSVRTKKLHRIKVKKI